MLSGDDRFRIDAIFEWLWSTGGLRTALATSWCAHTAESHPSYIRRGPLVLAGERRLQAVYVVMPATAEVVPVFGNPRTRCDTRPRVPGGRLVDVTGAEGPWWQKVSEAIEQLEAEVVQLRRANAPAPATSPAELEQARASFTRSSNRSTQG